MQRDQMIEVVRQYLSSNGSVVCDALADSVVPDEIVDALIAAGLVPSDELTQAARGRDAVYLSGVDGIEHVKGHLNRLIALSLALLDAYDAWTAPVGKDQRQRLALVRQMNQAATALRAAVTPDERNTP